jgi:hypothetical protein
MYHLFVICNFGLIESIHHDYFQEFQLVIQDLNSFISALLFQDTTSHSQILDVKFIVLTRFFVFQD